MKGPENSFNGGSAEAPNDTEVVNGNTVEVAETLPAPETDNSLEMKAASQSDGAAQLETVTPAPDDTNDVEVDESSDSAEVIDLEQEQAERQRRIAVATELMQSTRRRYEALQAERLEKLEDMAELATKIQSRYFKGQTSGKEYPGTHKDFAHLQHALKVFNKEAQPDRFDFELSPIFRGIEKEYTGAENGTVRERILFDRLEQVSRLLSEKYKNIDVVEMIAKELDTAVETSHEATPDMSEDARQLHLAADILQGVDNDERLAKQNTLTKELVASDAYQAERDSVERGAILSQHAAAKAEGVREHYGLEAPPATQ